MHVLLEVEIGCSCGIYDEASTVLSLIQCLLPEVNCFCCLNTDWDKRSTFCLSWEMYDEGLTCFCFLWGNWFCCSYKLCNKGSAILCRSCSDTSTPAIYKNCQDTGWSECVHTKFLTDPFGGSTKVHRPTSMQPISCLRLRCASIHHQ